MNPLLVEMSMTEAVKLESPEPARACRVCLAWDVKLHDIHERGLGDMYTEITGMTLSGWDGFPQHVCAWCRAQLERAAVLRARSRRADALLKQAIMDQHCASTITDSFIRTIDRSLHKLTHEFTVNSSENSALYYCVYDDTQEGTNSKQCLIEDIRKEDTENDFEDDTKGLDLKCEVDDDELPNQLSPDLNFKVNVENTNLSKLDDKIINKETIEQQFLDVKVVATKLDLNKTKAAKARKRPAQNGGQAKRKRKIKANDDKSEENIKVRKRKPQKFTEKFCTEEEIKDYEKKYNVKLKFLTDEEMLQDMEERKNSESYLRSSHKCELCFKGCSALTSYNNHMKSHAAVRGEYECHLCHWRYGSPGRLRDHIRYIHRIKFHCTLCSQVILGPDNVVAHAAFHAGTIFKCQYCDKHFKRKTSCWTHMRISHQRENFESSCELCGEIFTSRKGLKSHKTRSHREKVDKSMFCRKCRLQFDSEQAFQRHRNLQPGQRCYNNQSPCQQCGAVCPTEDALAQHKHDAHGVDLFTCDDCNKSFLSKSSLSVHIDRLHLMIRCTYPKNQYTRYTPKLTDCCEKRDYVCEECGKAFKYYSHLMQHKRRHGAVLPYKCDQCSRSFLCASSLREHIDCIHKRLRKWRCPECPKTFLHQSSVNVHRLIHNGKRTHMCTYCGKAFLQSGTLITHVKYVHLKIPPPPRKRNKKKNA